ncbi:apolipoprotein N-acyltransferase [Thiolapillus sp.]|uniref:apolipoprotein N-acyltransferase n=1 Tax=Thiolapillus sp. TaxID=2017437 RepID=UPI0025F370A5|nr:apolipoprotein N-acyltransferase [Thiolapillus sp.]
MTRIRLPVAFATGAVQVLAFAPFSQGWIALLSLAALFALWRGTNPKQAFGIGWAWGMGCMGFGVFWLHNSIAQFGGVSLPLAILLTLLFAAGLALFPALAGWLARRFFRGEVRQLLLVYPALWVLLEWLRSWLFTGFPWLTSGYSQIDTPLAGYAPLLGVYGVSLMLALTAAALNLWRSPWLLLAPLIWLTGWGLQQIHWMTPEGAPFTATLVQASIPQEKKWLPSQLRPTLEFYVETSKAHPDSRLVIWPETAVPAFADRVEKSFLQPLDTYFRDQGQDLLLGIPVRDAKGRAYNALISLGASGRGLYFKRHLVPFGEFMPFSALLQPLVELFAIPMSSFSSGDRNKPPRLKLAGRQAGVSICYEDTFGEEVAQALPAAAFLVNASNDAWFGDSLAPHQHLEMARMRALETGRYLLRATNTGVSAIVDETGRILAVLPQWKRGAITASIQPYEGETPFLWWKNWLAVVLAALMLLIAYLRREGGAPSTS